MSKKYWLFKSEPDVFSLDDLKNSKNQTTYWNGIRNYQARNFIRDEMKKGDKVLFYYSNAAPNAVVGICEITKDGYADTSQFETESEYFFPSADPQNPVWYMVDIKFDKELKHPVTLQEMKDNPNLKTMRLLQRGNRLSVMPVTKEEFDEIIKMGSSK